MARPATNPRLNQDEMDALGNLADCCMEDWARERAGQSFGSPAWRRATEEWEFWTHMALKLGCHYGNV